MTGIAGAESLGFRYNRRPMVFPRLRRPILSPEEEAQWIVRCQAGDPEAFRFLVEKYQDRAYWVAYHVVGSAEDAQDIVQEAFLRAFRAIPRFTVGMRFFTWFYRIIVHLSIDCLRKRRQPPCSRSEPDEEIEASPKDPAEDLLRDESVGMVQDLLERLPPRERAVLALRDMEGFSSKEIADLVGSNPATVRWWLFLARKKFRQEWEARYGKEDAI